jgi:hypothetical protein
LVADIHAAHTVLLRSTAMFQIGTLRDRWLRKA